MSFSKCSGYFELNCGPMFGSFSASMVLLVVIISMLMPSAGLSRELRSYNNIWVSPAEAAQLPGIISNATAGDTISLQPGVYDLTSSLSFVKDGVTMLSATGRYADVVLDGGYTTLGGNGLGEIVYIGASNITISGVSIAHAKWHAIHLVGVNKTVGKILLDNLHIYDCGEQLIKSNPSGSEPNTYYVDDVILQNSLIEFLDNSLMEPSGDGFYTGGLDVHAGLNWIVRDNIFRNISNNGALMEHAIHFWRKGRNAIIERNLIINCFRGVGFGLLTTPDPNRERFYDDGVGNSPYRDQIGGIVRNNVIVNDEGIFMDSGIAMANVQGAKVFHNTIVSGNTPAPFSCLEYRWDASSQIMNNLVSHNVHEREGNTNSLASHNLSDTYSIRNNIFKNVSGYDFALTSIAVEAIDKGIFLADVPDDYLKHPRGELRDIGAYEFTDTTTSAADNSADKSNDQFELAPNYPNPFNPVTKISYSIPRSSHVVLKVCNNLGNEVLELANAYQKAGNYSVTVDGRSLPSGTYYYLLYMDGSLKETRKMLLIK